MTRSTVPVRDGLPTSKELTHALAKLQIPLDRDAIGLGHMTEDRKVAALTAILNAWTQAYVMRAVEETKLGVEEYYMLVESSQAEVSVSPSAPELSPLIDTNMLVERMKWTEAHLAAVDGFSGRTMANPMRGIMQSLIGLVEQWRDAMGDPAARLGDLDASLADGSAGAEHMRQMVASVQELGELLFGPREPGADDA
ncbi:hypothetical protein [Streptomyces sp. NPDC087300]|uniref:hypothetical protein n=1 Tax=Streptomyces sp. NPDC087300 TaxID=3365780 RepID=UPI00380F4F79